MLAKVISIILVLCSFRAIGVTCAYNATDYSWITPKLTKKAVMRKLGWRSSVTIPVGWAGSEADLLVVAKRRGPIHIRKQFRHEQIGAIQAAKQNYDGMVILKSLEARGLLKGFRLIRTIRIDRENMDLEFIEGKDLATILDDEPHDPELLEALRKRYVEAILSTADTLMAEGIAVWNAINLKNEAALGRIPVLEFDIPTLLGDHHFHIGAPNILIEPKSGDFVIIDPH